MQELDQKTNNANKLVPWIIWGALNFSLLVYVFLCFFVRKEPATDIVPDAIYRSGLGIAFGAGLISILVFRAKLSREKINLLFQTHGAKYITSVFQFYIFCWAMNEVICIGGFLITFVGGAPAQNIVPYFVVAMFLNLVMAPFYPTVK